MATNEDSQEIGEFTSSAETDVPRANLVVDEVPDAVSGELWSQLSQDTPFPDVVSHLVRNGMRFTSVPFWCGKDDRLKLVKRECPLSLS